MANELQLYADPSSDSGLTAVARVYDQLGAQVGGDVACAEVGTLAIYIGDMPIASAGVYGVRFFDSDENLLGHGLIDWDGTAEITGVTIDSKLGGSGGSSEPAFVFK